MEKENTEGGFRKRKARDKSIFPDKKKRRVSFADVNQIIEYNENRPPQKSKKQPLRELPTGGRRSIINNAKNNNERSSLNTINDLPKEANQESENVQLIENSINDNSFHDDDDMRLTKTFDNELEEQSIQSIQQPNPAFPNNTNSPKQQPFRRSKQISNFNIQELQAPRKSKHDMDFTVSYGNRESLDSQSGDSFLSRASDMRFTMVEDNEIEKTQDPEILTLITPTKKGGGRKKSIFHKSPQLRKIVDESPIEQIRFYRNPNTPKITLNEFYKKVNIAFIDGITYLKSRKSDSGKVPQDLTMEDEVVHNLTYKLDKKIKEEITNSLMKECERIYEEDKQLETKYNDINPVIFSTVQTLNEQIKEKIADQLRVIKDNAKYNSKMKLWKLKGSALQAISECRKRSIAQVNEALIKLKERDIQLKEKISKRIEMIEKREKEHAIAMEQLHRQIEESTLKEKFDDSKKEKILEKFNTFKALLNCQITFVDKDHFKLVFSKVGFEIEIRLTPNNILAKYCVIPTYEYSCCRKFKEILLEECSIPNLLNCNETPTRIINNNLPQDETNRNGIKDMKTLHGKLLNIQQHEMTIRTLCEIIKYQLHIKRKIPMNFEKNDSKNGGGAKMSLFFKSPKRGLSAPLKEYFKVTFVIGLEYPSGCDFSVFDFQKIGNETTVEKKVIQRIVENVNPGSYFKLEQICDDIEDFLKNKKRT